MQPVVYLFPAITLVSGYRLIVRAWERRRSLGLAGAALLIAILLFGTTAAMTVRDYFGRWASAPEVRVQYETTFMTTLRYLAGERIGEAAVSTITPGPFHSPAVALLVVPPETAAGLRWFDARSSLLFPESNRSVLAIPGFTSVSPALASYLNEMNLVRTLPMRPTDLDRPVLIYHWVDADPDQLAALQSHVVSINGPPAVFGDALELLGYDLQTPVVAPGETVTLVTLWRLQRPLPNATLFTHLLGVDNSLIAQADLLGAPGESWQPGDLLLQLHQFKIPLETPAGEYSLVAGVVAKGVVAQGAVAPGAVAQPEGSRLPVSGPAADDNTVFLTTLVVAP
jgi:hypothetical protein